MSSIAARVYRSLMGGAMTAFPSLSGSRFFKPTKAFFEWAAANLKDGVIFDVGAGDGYTSLGLKSIGLNVMAIDAFPHADPVFASVQADGTSFKYPQRSTVMLCRPCHGNFPYLTVEQAVRREVDRVLYVGLSRNVNDDLGKYRRKFRVALKNAGESGEKVWMWNMRDRDATKNVALVKAEGWSAAYWMIDRDSQYWENEAGGRCPKSPGDVVLERSTIVDYDFQSLDWSKTGYIMADSEYGWLSPEGKFYPCEYMEHDRVAYYLIKKPVSELEAEGWVRVDDPGDGSGEHQGTYRSTFRCGGGEKDPNEVQSAWLKARGHNLDPYGLKDGGVSEQEAVRRVEEDEAARFEKYMQKAEELTGRKIPRPTKKRAT